MLGGCGLFAWMGIQTSVGTEHIKREPRAFRWLPPGYLQPYLLIVPSGQQG